MLCDCSILEYRYAHVERTFDFNQFLFDCWFTVNYKRLTAPVSAFPLLDTRRMNPIGNNLRFRRSVDRDANIKNILKSIIF